jgi:2-oxoglutarate ferredoxin oxidoreductase subunit beta
MTPKGMFGTTAPYGTVERSFDLCELAKASGATFVGRATTYHVPLLIDLIEKALQNDGFSVVESVGQCPTYLGRKNKIGDAVPLLNWIKDQAVNVKAAAVMSKEQLEGKFLIGELHNQSAPEYSAEYGELIQRVQRTFENVKGGLWECASNSD